MKRLNFEDAARWCSSKGIPGFPSSLADSDPPSRFTIPLHREFPKVLALGYTIIMTGLSEDSEGAFEGGLLWFREWGIWSETSDRVGWHIVSRLCGRDAQFDLGKTPGLLFDQSELVAVHATLVQPMAFGWDADWASQSGRFLLSISHERIITAAGVDPGETNEFFARFKHGGWNPEWIQET
jgi:hypothetical protein